MSCGSRLHHWLPTPLGAHLLCGTRFLASACSWEAPYQNCAFWHIAQTAYLCCCLGLLAGSELSEKAQKAKFAEAHFYEVG